MDNNLLDHSLVAGIINTLKEGMESPWRVLLIQVAVPAGSALLVGFVGIQVAMGEIRSENEMQNKSISALADGLEKWKEHCANLELNYRERMTRIETIEINNAEKLNSMQMRSLQRGWK